MTLARDTHIEVRVGPSAKRVGYAVAVAVNVALLYVANNLLEWGWPPFLTEDFGRLLPIVTVSLVASILVNLAYIAYDAKWFKSLTQIGLAVITMAVFIRTLQVFPFDFSPYDFNWETPTRAIIYICIVGVAIAIVVESVKLVVAVVRGSGVLQD